MTDSLGQIWLNLSEGQAILLGSLITVLGALLALLFGSIALGGKAKNLQDAIRVSGEAVEVHLTRQDQRLQAFDAGQLARMAQLSEASAQLNEVIAAVSGRINSIQDRINEPTDTPADNGLENPSNFPTASFEASPPTSGENTEPDRVEFKRDWQFIRAKIDEAATSPSIDGRTRAKYIRIDRRNYLEYFEAVVRDGNIPGPVDFYREAITLWSRHRTGRAPLNVNDLDRMREIREMIERQQIAGTL